MSFFFSLFFFFFSRIGFVRTDGVDAFVELVGNLGSLRYSGGVLRFRLQGTFFFLSFLGRYFRVRSFLYFMLSCYVFFDFFFLMLDFLGEVICIVWWIRNEEISKGWFFFLFFLLPLFYFYFSYVFHYDIFSFIVPTWIFSRCGGGETTA